jgi:hypothetical protein
VWRRPGSWCRLRPVAHADPSTRRSSRDSEPRAARGVASAVAPSSRHLRPASFLGRGGALHRMRAGASRLASNAARQASGGAAAGRRLPPRGSEWRLRLQRRHARPGGAPCRHRRSGEAGRAAWSRPRAERTPG